MNRPVVFRRAVLTAALVALVASAQAQTAKPPPRLPPTPSQTSQIPGGVDTGTPGGSDSLQLGTPVMSNSTGQPSALRGGSAAARAAARPKPTASSADCTKAAAGAERPQGAAPAVAQAGPRRQDVAAAAGQAAGRARRDPHRLLEHRRAAREWPIRSSPSSARSPPTPPSRR